MIAPLRLLAAAATCALVLAAAPAWAAEPPDPEEITAQDDERAPSSALTVTAEELRLVPGTFGDPLRGLSRLPGVSPLVFGAGPVVVRGSFPDATAILVDGVRVSWPFHLLAGPSSLSPDLLDRVDVYRSAAPARFGQLSGGAIDLKLPDRRAGPSRATASLDLLTLRALVDADLGPFGTRLTAAAGAFYSPWAYALISNLTSRPAPGVPPTSLVADALDYQAVLSHPLGPGELRLLALGAYDSGGLRSEGDHVLPLVQTHRLDLRYRAGPDQALEAGLTYGLDRLAFTGGGAITALDLEAAERSVGARVRWMPRLPALRLDLELGASLERRQADVGLGSTVRGPALPGQDPPVPVSVLHQETAAIGLFASAYGQATFRHGPWTVVPGLRLENAHLFGGIDQLAIDPRLWIDHRLSPALAFHGGGGAFHQPATTIVPLPGLPLVRLASGLQEVFQLTAGMSWHPRPELELTADGYLHPITRAVELSPADPEFPYRITAPEEERRQAVARQITEGHAVGLELMARRSSASAGDRLSGWISYALQRSARVKRFPRLDAAGQPQGEATASLPFTFDQTHVLNAVAVYRLPDDWLVSAAFHLHTGAPEAGGWTSQTMRPGVDALGRTRWVRLSLDEVDRLPPTLRVDARVSRTFTLGGLRLEAWLDVYNLLWGREVLSFSYAVVPQADGADRLEKRVTGFGFPVPMLGLRASAATQAR
jgi:hypothetical protein